MRRWTQGQESLPSSGGAGMGSDRFRQMPAQGQPGPSADWRSWQCYCLQTSFAFMLAGSLTLYSGGATAPSQHDWQREPVLHSSCHHCSTFLHVFARPVVIADSCDISFNRLPFHGVMTLSSLAVRCCRDSVVFSSSCFNPETEAQRCRFHSCQCAARHVAPGYKKTLPRCGRSSN